MGKCGIYLGKKFNMQIGKQQSDNAGNTCHSHSNANICHRLFTVLGSVPVQNKCHSLVHIQNLYMVLTVIRTNLSTESTGARR